MLHFASERAGEWYIPFVNTKIRAKVTAWLSLMLGKEVNRVRENERGWDALNENFTALFDVWYALRLYMRYL